jgi:hypothetical protein
MSNPGVVTEFPSNHAKCQAVREPALRVSLFCIITAFAFLVAISSTTVSQGGVPDDFTMALSP